MTLKQCIGVAIVIVAFAIYLAVPVKKRVW